MGEETMTLTVHKWLEECQMLLLSLLILSRRLSRSKPSVTYLLAQASWVFLLSHNQKREWVIHDLFGDVLLLYFVIYTKSCSRPTGLSQGSRRENFTLKKWEKLIFIVNLAKSFFCIFFSYCPAHSCRPSCVYLYRQDLDQGQTPVKIISHLMFHVMLKKFSLLELTDFKISLSTADSCFVWRSMPS